MLGDFFNGTVFTTLPAYPVVMNKWFSNALQNPAA